MEAEMQRKKLKPPEEWFIQADYDFEAAEGMFKIRKYLYAVFMCHLSIEKALKGLYAKELEEIPPKTHNLIFWLRRLTLVYPRIFMVLFFLLIEGKCSNPLSR